MGEASEDIRNLVTPPARPASTYRATASDSTKGAWIVRVAVRAIDLCWGGGGGKLKDSDANGTAADWRAWATSAIAGDEEHGRPGEYRIHQAIVHVHGRHDSDKELPYVRPTGLGFGTLRAKLKEGGHWQQAERELADTHSPASRPTRAATGATQDASAKAKAHAKANPRAASIPMPDTAVRHRNFETAEELIALAYPSRFNVMTRVFEDAAGQPVVHDKGLYLKARGRKLCCSNGKNPKPGDEPVYNPLSKTEFIDAFEDFGLENRFSPLHEWRDRIMDDSSIQPVSHKTMATDYLKAPGTGPHRMADLIMEKFMLSVALRIDQPGGKVDQLPVLLGPQYSGKSKFCAALGGPSFLDGVFLDDRNKDELMKYTQSMIGEVSELSTSRRDQNRLKALITTQSDQYRELWEKHPKPHPRRICFIATTNDRDLLNDPSGSRRYGVIEVTALEIDVAKVLLHRDGLFKSAIQAQQAGAVTYMGREELEQLTQDNSAYDIGDARDEMLSQWLVTRGEQWIRTEGFTLADVMIDAFGMDKEKIGSRADQNAVGVMLRKAGFEKKRNVSRFVDGKVRRVHRWMPLPSWPGLD